MSGRGGRKTPAAASTSTSAAAGRRGGGGARDTLVETQYGIIKVVMHSTNSLQERQQQQKGGNAGNATALPMVRSTVEHKKEIIGTILR